METGKSPPPSIPPADDLDQAFDMRDWGVLPDPMAEIENVRPFGKRLQHAQGLPLQLGPACKEQQRIKISLYRQLVGQFLRRPGGIDRLDRKSTRLNSSHT